MARVALRLANNVHAFWLHSWHGHGELLVRQHRACRESALQTWDSRSAVWLIPRALCPGGYGWSLHCAARLPGCTTHATACCSQHWVPVRVRSAAVSVGSTHRPTFMEPQRTGRWHPRLCRLRTQGCRDTIQPRAQLPGAPSAAACGRRSGVWIDGRGPSDDRWEAFVRRSPVCVHGWTFM